MWRSFFLACVLINSTVLPYSSPLTCAPCQGVNQCRGTYLGFAVFYWSAEEDGLELAVDDPSLVIPANIYDFDYSWDVGFRLFVEKQLGCNGFSLYLGWTHFTEEASLSLTRLEANLYPSPVPPLTGTFPVASAEGDNALSYDVIDALFGRTFCLCNNSLFTPFLGVRLLWLNQEFFADYQGGAIDGTLRFINHGDITSGGLCGGVNYTVSVVRGLYFFGTISGSVLSARFDEKQNLISIPEVDPTEELFSAIGEQHIGILGYTLAAGIGYTSCFFSCADLNFAFSYEMNHLSNTPRPRRFDSNGTEVLGTSTHPLDGHILLQGFTLRASLGF